MVCTGRRSSVCRRPGFVLWQRTGTGTRHLPGMFPSTRPSEKRPDMTADNTPGADSPAPTPAPAEEAAPVQNPLLPEGVTYCNFDDFSKIRLTVAEIIQAEAHPKADKLIKLQLRLGDREKQICAGIRAYYTPEELVGKRIIVVDNLEPRKLRGETSHGMLLAARGPDDTLALVTLDKPDFPTGGQVS